VPRECQTVDQQTNLLLPQTVAVEYISPFALAARSADEEKIETDARLSG
jgi:hypothetical protein